PSPLRRRKRPLRVPMGRSTAIREDANSSRRFKGREQEVAVGALKDEQRQFLDRNPFVGTVTTLRPDGSPHSTVVWVDVEDGKVSFNTALGRAKPRHLEHDPRASILVIDPNDPFKWVAVEGHVELTEEG